MDAFMMSSSSFGRNKTIFGGQGDAALVVIGSAKGDTNIEGRLCCDSCVSRKRQG